MPRVHYDGIRTSYKLGNDLQVGPIDDGVTRLWPVDEFDAGTGHSDVLPLISICVHQGSLFVTWCEAQQDTSDPHVSRFVDGPFVKRYDPASNTWIQVGVVEPSLLVVDQDDRAAWNAIPSPYSLGTRFLPKLARLVSDGTSLFCVYAIHETVAGAGSSFSPFKLAIRRWTGAAWELYGEIPAVGYNDHGTSGGFAGTNYSRFSGISAAASPYDSGACYVTLVQAGEYAEGSSSSGDFLYQGVVGRFDGSSLDGDVRVIGTPGVDHVSDFTEFVNLAVRYDDADGPWIWTRLGGGGFPNENALIRWSDMAVVQSWPNGVLPFVQGPTGYRGGAWLCSTLVAGTPNFTAVRELASDGSTSTSDQLDGLPDLPFPIAFYLAEPPSHNIWVVGGEGQIWLYHLPCRAWTLLDFTFTPVASDPYSGLPRAFWDLAFRLEGGRNLGVASVGESGFPGLDSVLRSGVIYVAAWLTDSVEDVTKIRVYAAPIQRNKHTCRDRGVETLPYFIPLGNQPAS